MGNNSRVEVDATSFLTALARLGGQLTIVVPGDALQVANRVADAIRGGVHILTGNLHDSITVIEIPGGAAITYGYTASGEPLPYAWVYERRFGAIESGVQGADVEFHQQVTETTKREIRRL